MIIWGRPSIGSSLAGDVVSTRRLQFSSQEEEIRFLRAVVDEYRSVYAIRARARDIVFRQRGCAPKDHRCHALAIASWVQNNITYVEELPETFQAPTSTVAQGYGDCDDFTTLIAAMLESIGIESELVGVYYRGYYRHIFPRAVLLDRLGQPTMRLPLDATLQRSVYDLADPVRIAQGRGESVKLYVV